MYSYILVAFGISQSLPLQFEVINNDIQNISNIEYFEETLRFKIYSMKFFKGTQKNLYTW